MSVHENSQTVSSVLLLADPTLGSVTAAESVVAAFKLALKELGEPVPANDVRAVLTSSGMRLEVTAAPTTTVTNYGTPAPVEEIAEFLGEPVTFALGDSVRINGNGVADGRSDTPMWHGFSIGAVGEIVELPDTPGGAASWAPGHYGVKAEGTVLAVHPSHIERADDRVALPADSEAGFTVEELDLLRVGYRVYDYDGDQWEKRAEGDWGFVRPSADSVSPTLTFSAAGLIDAWGPLTREAPE